MGLALGIFTALGVLLLPAILIAAVARVFAARERDAERAETGARARYLEPVASWRAAPASPSGGRNVS